MKTYIFYLSISVLLFSGLYACKGPQGEMGPQGPQGTPGATGAQGAQGPQGAKGDAGTANVFTSSWITVKPQDWFMYGGDSTYYNISFKEARVNQTLLDKGMIVCYFRYSDDTKIIYPLPYTYVGGAAVLNFYPTLAETEPRVVFEISLQEPYDMKKYPYTLEYRYIIIPAALSGRMKSINWKNYEEVKQALNIID